MTGRVRIELAQHAVGSSVWLDDHDISACLSAVTIEARVGESSRVTLEVLPKEVSISGEAGEVQREWFQLEDSRLAPWRRVARRSWQRFADRMAAGLAES